MTSGVEAIDNHFLIFDEFNTIDPANKLSSNGTLGFNWEVLDYRDNSPSEDPHGILLALKKSPKKKVLTQTSIAFQKCFHRNFPMTTSQF